MIPRAGVVAVLLCATVLQVGATQPAVCAPDGDVKFICGPVSPEDLVMIPQSEWVVVSGMYGGGVHVVNARDFQSTRVLPVAAPKERFDRKTYGACPGPMDPAEKEKFDAHGLAVREGRNRVHTLYLVHHGFRESVEVFEVDARTVPPTFTWIGCAIAPRNTMLNAVSPLPRGGFVATNFSRRDVERDALLKGTNTGEVWEWNAVGGWTIVPGSDACGPNGIEASKDGRWLYVNLWPGSQVVRLSRGPAPAKKDVIDLPFHPDNIRWQADGTLLAAGHGGGSTARVLECMGKVCAGVTSDVARIHPETLKVDPIIRYPATEVFKSATAALQVGGEIWLGSITGNRIARYPLR